MWYKVIPPFVPLVLNLYLVYLIGTKRFDSWNFRNYISYVRRNVSPKLKQPIVPPIYTPYSIGK